MVVSSYISPKVRKGGPSAIEGRGLMALAPIAKDELVAIKGGHIVDTATLRSLPERLANSDVQIADGFHLVALEEAEYEPVMLFINHSCDQFAVLTTPSSQLVSPQAPTRTVSLGKRHSGGAVTPTRATGPDPRSQPLRQQR